MSVAQATHQEVLATKILRNDQNENLGAERFCRGKKQKRGQRPGNQRSREHTERPGSGLGSDSGFVVFQLCGLEYKFLQCSVPPLPHLKTHLVRRITEEEVGKVGRSAGQCLTPGSLTKGVRGGW